MAKSRGSVCLVEDEVAVRQSLALLLQLHGFATSEFASAEDFLAAPLGYRPACALVDIRLPGMSGLALQARMACQLHAPPVVLMTAHGDAAIARSALLQGASDFLEKPIDETELILAVESALRSDAERHAANLESDKLIALVAALTRDERVLFEHITSGRQIREIAEQFGLSVQEMEARRLHVMQKLQVRRLADLFRLRFRVDAVPVGHK